MWPGNHVSSFSVTMLQENQSQCGRGMTGSSLLAIAISMLAISSTAKQKSQLGQIFGEFYFINTATYFKLIFLRRHYTVKFSLSVKGAWEEGPRTSGDWPVWWWGIGAGKGMVWQTSPGELSAKWFEFPNGWILTLVVLIYVGQWQE